MTNSTPLNPFLYSRMRDYYGEVEIVRTGQANNWRTIWEARPGQKGRSPHRRMLASGEEYRVRCMACRDHRARLYINHRWGVFDPETNSRNLWLANCYNESCYSDYEGQRILYEKIYIAGSRFHTMDEIAVGKVAEPEELRPVPDPGPMIRLDHLAAKYPNHDAIVYLANRGFDPAMLGRYWKVAFCPQSRYRWATNRIIIPIFQEGMQVGWQTRHIGDDVLGVPFNEAGVPKYWSNPELPRRLVAYNLDRALQHSTVVAVEGPSDVWNVGPMAVAALGKTFSPHVRRLIIDGMRRFGSEAVLVVAFDPQPDRSKKKAELKTHPIDVLYNYLQRPFSEFGGCVIPLWLPQEYDPGSIDRRRLQELIKIEAKKVGRVARLGRPPMATS